MGHKLTAAPSHRYVSWLHLFTTHLQEVSESNQGLHAIAGATQLNGLPPT